MLDSTLEWLMEMEAGHWRSKSRETLMLAQAVQSIFDTDSWQQMQEKLNEES